MVTYSTTIRVFIADQQQVVRAGLKLMLAELEHVEVVGEGADADATTTLVLQLEPDLLIVDEHLPPAGATELVKEIKQQLPKTKILVWTSQATLTGARQAVASGALGFCDKGVTRQELELVLRSVAAGAGWLHRAVSSELLNQVGNPALLHSLPPSRCLLSAREVEVLTLLASGYTNLEIAQQLSISNETVKTHVAHIMQKLAVKDRTQAAIKALREKLIETIEPRHAWTGASASPPA
jgi:DNA-binding NarL/FixJ family response regulator